MQFWLHTRTFKTWVNHLALQFALLSDMYNSVICSFSSYSSEFYQEVLCIDIKLNEMTL